MSLMLGTDIYASDLRYYHRFLCRISYGYVQEVQPQINKKMRRSGVLTFWCSIVYYAWNMLGI